MASVIPPAVSGNVQQAGADRSGDIFDRLTGHNYAINAFR
jgi:hypothetical protein